MCAHFLAFLHNMGIYYYIFTAIQIQPRPTVSLRNDNHLSMTSLSNMSAFTNMPLSNMYLHGNDAVEWPHSYGSTLPQSIPPYFVGEGKIENRTKSKSLLYVNVL